MRKILITGGAGFIGSHLVRLFVKNYTNYHIYNLDALTYAGNLYSLMDIENEKNYTFLKGNINNENYIKTIFEKYRFDAIIHLAAESHVDRSIIDPLIFAKTNILGTINLLKNFKIICKNNWKDKLFYHISTDEVYGSLGKKGLFNEKTSYNPNSPYSASKASSDHFVRACGKTYDIPFIISNCSNNYGPNQNFEKLIPLTINNILHKIPIPVYGDGKNIRDWLFVHDHVMAIEKIFHKGVIGQNYNIGGLTELKNIDLVKLICDKMDIKLGRSRGSSRNLITFIEDRSGHDYRYGIDISKIKKELGWSPKFKLDDGLDNTIDWYLSNPVWLKGSISKMKFQKEQKNLNQ